MRKKMRLVSRVLSSTTLTPMLTLDPKSLIIVPEDISLALMAPKPGLNLMRFTGKLVLRSTTMLGGPQVVMWVRWGGIKKKLEQMSSRIVNHPLRCRQTKTTKTVTMKTTDCVLHTQIGQTLPTCHFVTTTAATVEANKAKAAAGKAWAKKALGASGISLVVRNPSLSSLGLYITESAVTKRSFVIVTACRQEECKHLSFQAQRLWRWRISFMSIAQAWQLLGDDDGDDWADEDDNGL